ncbi:MAG: transcription antitermination factor NusB [Phycisphaerales bacterium]
MPGKPVGPPSRSPRPEHVPGGEPRRVVSTGDGVRDAALAFLAHQAARFPDLDLRPFHAPELAGRDAALAHAIVDVAVRRWITLAYLLNLKCSQGIDDLEPPLRGALLGGAAQIVLLDKVPAHAAINHAVEWATRRMRRGAGAMANAVLRRVSEMVGERTADTQRAQHDAADADQPTPLPTPQPPPSASGWDAAAVDRLPLADGRTLTLRGVQLPADPLARLEVATGHPRALLEGWAKKFGLPEAARLALHGIVHPPVILRVGAAGEDGGSAYLPLPRGAMVPHARAGFGVFTGDHDALVALLNDRDDVWVQDPASAEAVASVADLKPACVYDLCAGMGTKTRQLAATFPGAKIVATDIDPRRLRVLQETFKGHARVRVIEPANWALDHAGAADLVLLDVPCSNSGVLARRPEAKYRFAPAASKSLVDTQRQIIADAIPLVSARGSILYSTCSLEDAENAHQGAWLCQWHRFRASRERTTLPAGGWGCAATDYSDGSFSVLLSRRE